MKRPTGADRGSGKRIKIEELSVDDPVEVRKHLFKAGGLMPSEGYDGPGKWTLAGPGVGKYADSAPVELVYLAIRGLGQLTQLCLEAAGYPYRYTLVTGPYFRENLKAHLVFGRLPCLRTENGTELVQSKAVLRYVAKLAGLAGKDDEEQARCDMLNEMLLTEAELDSKEIAQLEGSSCLEPAGDLKALGRVATHGLDKRERTMCSLKFWEDMLSRSNSGWLLGGMGDGGPDELCYVDLSVYWTLRPHKALLQQLGCQKLSELISRVGDLPGVKRLIDSGRMMPEIGEGYLYKEDDLVKKP